MTRIQATPVPGIAPNLIMETENIANTKLEGRFLWLRLRLVRAPTVAKDLTPPNFARFGTKLQIANTGMNDSDTINLKRLKPYRQHVLKVLTPQTLTTPSPLILVARKQRSTGA